MAYSVEEAINISLGVQGENLARTIEFDVSPFLQKWPDAEITLLVKRKRDIQPYIAATSMSDGILFWPVTASDTEYAGEGKLEIRVICGDVVAKTATGKFTVLASMTGSEADTPEASQSWVNQVIASSKDAAISAAAAKVSAQEAQEAVAALEAQGAPVIYVFISSEDMESGTANMSPSELLEAANSGKAVYAIIQNILVPPVAFVDDSILFCVHIPGEGDLAIILNEDKSVYIEVIEATGSSTKEILFVTLSSDQTVDKSFEEIMATLDSGGMVYMLYQWGSDVVVILHPVYVNSGDSIAFLGEISVLRFAAVLNSDGTVTIDDKMFDKHITIQIEQDEENGVYYVPGSWNGTAIYDEIAIGKSISANLPGVGNMSYAGSVWSSESNNTLPTFEAHCWDSVTGTLTFVQARFLQETYILDNGSYQQKVEIIRWKLPGERITEA